MIAHTFSFIAVLFPLFLSVDIRALDVWGSHEALARERNLRKEVEREYQESRFCASL